MIKFKRKTLSLNPDEFHAIDKKIMRLAFDIHNTMGRFFDEKIYQNELMALCRKNGIESEIEVDIISPNGNVGKQKFCLLNDSTTFHLSAIKQYYEDYEDSIRQLLKHTPLRFAQWINFNNHTITFKTIRNSIKQN